MRFSGVFLCIVTLSLFSSGCSDVTFGPNQKAKESRFQSNGVVINENAPFTNESNVILKLFGSKEQEVYITNDPTCKKGGKWIPFVETQEWVLAQLNTQVSVYAQFRDPSTTSNCMSDSIIHDDIPPQLGFKVLPDPESHKSNDYFILEAIDNVSGVSTYYCGDETNHKKCAERVDLSNLSEGTNNFSYFAEDKAGNMAHPIAYQWLIDLTPPSVRWLNTPKTLATTTTAHFEFSATDNYTQNPVLECDLDKQGFSPCASPYNLSSLPEGGHTLQLRGRDRVGNITNPLVYEWVVDTIPPIVKIVEAPNRYINQPVSKFKLTTTDTNHPVFECRIDGNPFTSCLAEESFSLSEGEHKFSVRTSDLAGNISPQVSHEWGIDLTAPVVEIISHPDLLTNDVNARFIFTGTDTLSGIRWAYCSIDGVMAKCMGSTGYNNLGEGSHRFEVYAEDMAGNRSTSQSYEWRIDSMSPSVKITSGPKQWSNSAEAFFEFKGIDSSGEISHYECSVGKDPFQPCRSPHRVPNLVESNYTFRVVAYDRAGNTSPEVSHSWNVDLTPPIVNWDEVPNRHEFYIVSFASFSASDTLSGIKESHCQANSNNLPCRASQRFKTDHLFNGQNQLDVNVFDGAGNMASLNHQWEVYSPYRDMSQPLLINESDRDIDILFVVDNSGSMSKEQKNISDRIDNFINNIVDLNWRIAVTSTDPRASHHAGDGKLVPFSNGEFHIDHTMDVEIAQEYLGEAVYLGSDGHNTEQGIRATYRAIERAKDTTSENQEKNEPNREFLRDTASMAVVLISDEDEGRKKHKNKAENLVQLVNDTWNSAKDFVFHSIIVEPGDDKCLEGEGQQLGREYARLSQMTGGDTGSICETHYSSQLKDIGSGVRSQVFTIQLECLPVDRDRDGNVDILVHLEDGSLAPDFTRDGQKLTFVSPLPLGNHNIQYSCLKK